MNNDLTIFNDYNNKMSASFKLYAVNESDINVEIQAQIFSEILVSIEVPPQNKLSAIYDLVEAPLTSSVNHPVIDSFVTSDTPYNTMNYGENKSLMVGKNIKGNHIGLIQFDLSHISPTVVLQGARLRIYYSYLEDMTDIALYTARDEWSELGVTYLNRPRMQKFVSNEYTINKDKNYIEFIVTNTVLEWLKGINNNGFVLTSESLPSVFRSRESTYSPALYVDYKEPPTHKSDYRKISVDLMVRGLAEDNINVDLTVHSEYKNDSIDVELLVHNPNDIIESDVLVELESIAKPVYSEESDVLVEITSAIEGSSTISVNIEVTKHEVENDIDVELWVQREDSSEIDVDLLVVGANHFIDESSIDVEIDVIGLYTNTENSINVDIEVPSYNKEDGINVEITAIKYFNLESNIDTEITVADRIKSESNIDVELMTQEAVKYDKEDVIDVEIYVRIPNTSDIDVEIIVPHYDREDEIQVQLEVKSGDNYYSYVYMI